MAVRLPSREADGARFPESFGWCRARAGMVQGFRMSPSCKPAPLSWEIGARMAEHIYDIRTSAEAEIDRWEAQLVAIEIHCGLGIAESVERVEAHRRLVRAAASRIRRLLARDETLGAVTRAQVETTFSELSATLSARPSSGATPSTAVIRSAVSVGGCRVASPAAQPPARIRAGCGRASERRGGACPRCRRAAPGGAASVQCAERWRSLLSSDRSQRWPSALRLAPSLARMIGAGQ